MIFGDEIGDKNFVAFGGLESIQICPKNICCRLDVNMPFANSQSRVFLTDWTSFNVLMLLCVTGETFVFRSSKYGSMMSFDQKISVKVTAEVEVCGTSAKTWSRIFTKIICQLMRMDIKTVLISAKYVESVESPSKRDFCGRRSSKECQISQGFERKTRIH